MIFVTVGMQLGFDRLIRAMDEIAPNLGEEVIAQIGSGEYVPRNISFQRHYTPEEIAAHFAASRVVVAHAGVGTILAAERHSKPLVIIPRRSALAEHRNDHQLATARHLQNRPGITAAFETKDLANAIAHAASVKLGPDTALSHLDELKQAIAIFIENGNLTSG